MLSFILVASLITVCCMIWLVRPLLKTPDSDSYERQAQNIHYAKERLVELEQQLSSSSISADDYQALKLEIESTLARDIDISKESLTNRPDEKVVSNKLLIALLCCLIPLSSLGIYQLVTASSKLGSHAKADGLAGDTNGTGGNTVPAIQATDVQAMVSSLEQRLQSSPDDPQGWTMLARSYHVLGRFQDAINANLKLLELAGESPDIYAALADSSALLAGGAMAGPPTAYAQKALQLKPDHPQGLWLTGLAAAQLGNGEQARNYWNQLVPLLAGNPPQQKELQGIIQQSIDFENSVVPAKSVTDNNAQLDAGDSSGTSSTTVTTGLTVNVSLGANLNQVTPDKPVFVYARAQNGPPAPLAVKKLKVSDLPATLTLSDQDAMMDQFKLSRYEDVVVSARIALSGNPIAQPGDFQSQIVKTRNTNSDTLELIISTVVE